jgi:flagellar L-ring protein precursor FlgH
MATGMISVKRALFAATAIGTLILSVPSPAHASKKKTEELRAEYAATAPVEQAAPVADGAIFHVRDGYAPLVAGARSARVGDVLTIVLIESTQASKSNSASTSRGGSISVTPPPTGPIATILNKVNLNMAQSAAFDGKGAAAQSNQLTGAISVTVAQVLANGNLLVKGEKQLTLNRGDEQIRISGIVRPVDIDQDNNIPSTRVADARITYSGKGEIARASTQGWLGRFFSRIAPF